MYSALSPPSIPRRGALEQGTKPPTAPWVPQHKWLPTAPGVCSLCLCVHCCVCARSINGCPLLRVCVHCVCVFTAVCVHLGWVKCRAQIPSMGHFLLFLYAKTIGSTIQ